MATSQNTSDVTVCIPWRAQPQRLAAFAAVTDWWQSRGYRIALGDGDASVFNISQARNRAVSKARTEIVIVADADTIPDQVALTVAQRQLEAHMVIYPFNVYRYIEAEPVVGVNPAELPESRQYRGSVGGLFMTTKATYDEVGRHDEGFEQWGFEDNAFHLAADTLGRVVRITGIVHAYGHEAVRDMSRANPGRARAELYRFAHNKPAIMRELIKGRTR